MTISTAETEIRRQRRNRCTVITASAMAAITLVLLAILWWMPPHRLQPDEIIREPGEYLSPARDYQLTVSVSDSDGGTIRVRLARPDGWNDELRRLMRQSPVPGRSSELEFAAERDWFLCFDEFDRLWFFRGPGDRQSGPLQDVTMFGFFFGRNGLVNDAIEPVSMTGDWRGVPPQFFARIPAKDDQVAWGDIPPIPAEPPEFSPAERQAAAARRR